MHFYVVSAYFGVVLQGRKDQKLCIFTCYPHTLALFRKPQEADSMHFYVVSAYFGMVSQGMGEQKLCIFRWYPHTLALFRKPQEGDSMHFYVESACFGTVSQGMEQQILYIFTWYPHTLAWFRKAWIGTIYVFVCGIHMIWLAKVRSKRSPPEVDKMSSRRLDLSTFWHWLRKSTK